MKRQAKFVLILLSTLAVIAGAQSSTPLPEVATLVRQAIQQQRLAESKEQEYVFREETNDIRLNKDCTWAPKCPAPFGVRGVKGVGFHVIRYTEHDFEIFWLDGVRVARVLPSCSDCGREMGPEDSFIRNIPISDSELAAENQRVDREVAEAKALRAQGKDANSPDNPPQILFSRILELCTFSNPRRQVIHDRSTILLDFVWNPSINPVGANEALLKFFSGTVGIDEEDHAVQQVEGGFLADANLSGGAIKIRKGTRVTITNRRLEAGIWMLSRLDARGEGHYFAFAIDGDGHIFTGNYWKFQSTSRMLPGFTEEPPKPPTSPSPPPALKERAPSTEPPTPETWVDPSTGLMWAGKDNGRDVNWHKAVKYCRDLRLAGYSDWGLPTLAELEGIYDKKANAPGLAGHGTVRAFNWHVKGNLFLTGYPWSITQRLDDRGRPSGLVWYLDFLYGTPHDDDGSNLSGRFADYNKRALCVRGSGGRS